MLWLSLLALVAQERQYWDQTHEVELKWMFALSTYYTA